MCSTIANLKYTDDVRVDFDKVVEGRRAVVLVVPINQINYNFKVQKPIDKQQNVRPFDMENKELSFFKAIFRLLYLKIIIYL